MCEKVLLLLINLPEFWVSTATHVLIQSPILPPRHWASEPYISDRSGCEKVGVTGVHMLAAKAQNPSRIIIPCEQGMWEPVSLAR